MVIPPAIRDYVQQAIAEAMPKQPDTQAIAAEVSRTIEAQLSYSLKSVIDQSIKSFKDELAASLELFKEDADKVQSLSMSALQAAADLENQLRDWTDRDRYQLTRAQVTRIMRELNV
jgi:hypothetical protein